MGPFDLSTRKSACGFLPVPTYISIFAGGGSIVVILMKIICCFRFRISRTSRNRRKARYAKKTNLRVPKNLRKVTTRACSRCWDSGSSATWKSARATSPEAVYSQRGRATCGSLQADSVSAATPKPKLGNLHHGRDRQDGCRGGRPRDSLSRPLDRGVLQSREVTNRRRCLAKCPRAQRV